MEPAPLCPKCYLQTAYDSEVPTDDTWSCDIRGCDGIVLSAEHVNAHPGENAVLIVGTDHRWTHHTGQSAKAA
ncbi:hypothetical protein [Kitasatospora sp. SUK 42]|uniref:hypothetical protein n=1 Tax=Kitasatospora sp. SUK 42 TaxID=1588882 RepID=UPI0018C99ED1|nr:hypothetical protein [Kitasatospora sp. SUK 42]MBV2155057.1 hypothetical protein [Kitasatospora sp. SUK 42]